MAKKIHWTQRPENREKLLAMQDKGRKTRQTKNGKTNRKKDKRPKHRIIEHTPDRSLLVQLVELKNAADARLKVIDEEILKLQQERKELLANFPQLSSDHTFKHLKEA